MTFRVWPRRHEPVSHPETAPRQSCCPGTIPLWVLPDGGVHRRPAHWAKGGRKWPPTVPWCQKVGGPFRAFMRSLGGGEPFEAEYRLRDRHGNYRWFLGRAVHVTDEAGRIVSVFGTATDIDDRRRSEQAARFLADASATLAALVDETGTLQQVARRAVPHFADWCVVDMAGEDGAPQRLAVAHVDPAKVALAHEMQRRYPPNREASTGVSAILRSGKPELVPEVTDEMLVARARDEDHLQIIRKLGLRSYIGVPLPGRDGTLGVISFVASDSGRHYGPDDLRLVQDLACRAAVAVENARLYEKMKEADRRKDEFLATLAHELRNPLAPIRNALQLMARSSGVDHEAERAMAERLVTHLARLVDDLLDVARITRGRIELRNEVVELAPIVARVVQMVGPSASERRHELVTSLPEQPVLLDADPTRLEQILWNLLSNAIKYTEPGGRISLTARQHDGELVLHVCDTGIGIPAEMLAHVFEMFSHGEPVLHCSQGGLGIGLGLVKSLVELHGGTIEAHSDGPGRGSEFLVRLPVFSHALAPVKRDACCGDREGSGTVDDCRRILVVDDNEDAATSLARLLSMLDGHTVQVAHDGPSALALAADFEPEVVILDIGMPGMDGYEVARRFRARPESQQTRLVALSGWGQEKDRERSRAAGFDHHLVKPVDLELLSRPSGHRPCEADFLAVTGKQRVPCRQDDDTIMAVAVSALRDPRGSRSSPALDPPSAQEVRCRLCPCSSAKNTSSRRISFTASATASWTGCQRKKSWPGSARSCSRPPSFPWPSRSCMPRSRDPA